MLWVKAFHIVFVVAWYAGLLYLPRLFVYHAMADGEADPSAPGAGDGDAGRERFKAMERKLFAIMTIGGLGALVLGVWLLLAYAWQAHAASGWLHAKLALAAGLVAYHLWCGKVVADFRRGRNRRGHRFYRAMNEIPAVLLVAIVVLAVVKPF